MLSDDAQLAFDVGQSSAALGAAPQHRRRFAVRRPTRGTGLPVLVVERQRSAVIERPNTETTLTEVCDLASAARRAEVGVATARLLLQLRSAVDAALDAAVADAYAQYRSWRKLSELLDIPFQTLHRKFGTAKEEANDRLE